VRESHREASKRKANKTQSRARPKAGQDPRQGKTRRGAQWRKKEPSKCNGRTGQGRIQGAPTRQEQEAEAKECIETHQLGSTRLREEDWLG